MRLSVKERVANGARWLDENFPGWMDRINLETLDLNDSERCICGQVFKEEAAVSSDWIIDSGYGYARRNLFLEANSWITTLVPMDADHRVRQVSYVLGFDTGDYGSDRTWQRLQKAWVDLLKERASVTFS